MKQIFPDRYVFPVVFIVISALFSAGCAVVEKEPLLVTKVELIKIPASAYPKFSDDIGFDGLEHAIGQSLSYLKKIPIDREFRFGNELFTASHIVKSLERFRNYIQTKPSPQNLKQFIQSNYLVYQSVGSDRNGRVLFTGYYEPFLQGTLTKTQNTDFLYMLAPMI